jgi:hypothetical protein
VYYDDDNDETVGWEMQINKITVFSSSSNAVQTLFIQDTSGAPADV